MTRPQKIRLGEILLQQKLISHEQLQIALDEQKRSRRKLGRVFVDSGFVTEDTISGALARQLNIPYIHLKQYNLKPQTVQRLPEMQARRFRAIVLEDQSHGLLVGMADPTDLFAYDEITRITKRSITLAVVNEQELLHAIDRMYRRTEEITTLARELEQELGDDVIDFGALGLSAGADEAPVVRLLQTVFDDATQVRASDIHIEPQEKSLHIRFRIDGVLHLQTEADIRIAPALALRLKLTANLDISEKRLPQDGRFAVTVRKQLIDVRISTMPTQYGESVVMRLLNQSGGMLDLSNIGMPPKMLERFRAIIQRPNGLVLVTGPTGSGKTTTLYGALSELSTDAVKVITVEDPVEYRLPGINQVQVNEKINLDFARVLRSALRQDPDIVLVGEMRDHETAQIGLRAAMTGHMVLSTLHTNDAASTPLRLIDMGVPHYMVGSSLQAVLAQRLVRLVCENCIEPYPLLPNEREWLKGELKDQVDNHAYMHGIGCSYCNGTGFRGRIGVYELLEMTREVADAANHADPGVFIRLAQRELGGHTLRSHAVALVLEGKTTVGEAMRVTTQLED
ncbi:MAG: GspE/PulE family protein [Burkholderiaceae bacterium]|nr:GspE/PulE family protein [Burkholderiaceae bacterium]